MKEDLVFDKRSLELVGFVQIGDINSHLSKIERCSMPQQSTTAIVEDWPLFFISDPSHLIKTVRSCWANSYCHSYTRKLNIRYTCLCLFSSICLFPLI